MTVPMAVKVIGQLSDPEAEAEVLPEMCGTSDIGPPWCDFGTDTLRC